MQLSDHSGPLRLMGDKPLRLKTAGAGGPCQEDAVNLEELLGMLVRQPIAAGNTVSISRFEHR